jgi:DNA-binding GntR family transcriptional regulator
MSLLPVSEAMLRLEHEGLLESRPRAELAFACQLRRTVADTTL